MLMPQKHINLSESLIGIGGFILNIVKNKRKTIDTIIKDVEKLMNNKKSKKIYNNIDNIILSIDYLYSIGTIDIDEKGRIYNVSNKTDC